MNKPRIRLYNDYDKYVRKYFMYEEKEDDGESSDSHEISPRIEEYPLKVWLNRTSSFSFSRTVLLTGAKIITNWKVYVNIERYESNALSCKVALFNETNIELFSFIFLYKRILDNYTMLWTRVVGDATSHNNLYHCYFCLEGLNEMYHNESHMHTEDQLHVVASVSPNIQDPFMTELVFRWQVTS